MNSPRPTLLFYSQHSVGIGHLVRSFNLVRGLLPRFRVVLLNGGPLPDDQVLPDGLELVQLPPLCMGHDHELVSLAPDLSLDEARALRRALILASLTEFRPRIVVVELFPFGRKKFADEILALLEAARSQSPPPLVVSSVRDILISGRRDQQRHDDLAAEILDGYFDAVLVHTDPGFVRLDESFRPRRPSRVPIHYTGFVAAGEADARPLRRERRLLVAAGGGRNGAPLYAAALAAHEHLWAAERLPMTIVAGPLLPEMEWRELQWRADGRRGLQLLRSVPSLRDWMARVTWSVGRCGYNSAMDILLSGVSALVVPFVEPGDDEQTERARRMAERGLLRVLPGEALDGARLAAAIRELGRFRPSPARLDLGGAAATAGILAGLLAAAPSDAGAPLRPTA